MWKQLNIVILHLLSVGKSFMKKFHIADCEEGNKEELHLGAQTMSFTRCLSPVFRNNCFLVRESVTVFCSFFCFFHDAKQDFFMLVNDIFSTRFSTFEIHLSTRNDGQTRVLEAYLSFQKA